MRAAAAPELDLELAIGMRRQIAARAAQAHRVERQLRDRLAVAAVRRHDVEAPPANIGNHQGLEEPPPDQCRQVAVQRPGGQAKRKDGLCLERDVELGALVQRLPFRSAPLRRRFPAAPVAPQSQGHPATGECQIRRVQIKGMQRLRRAGAQRVGADCLELPDGAQKLRAGDQQLDFDFAGYG